MVAPGRPICGSSRAGSTTPAPKSTRAAKVLADEFGTAATPAWSCWITARGRPGRRPGRDRGRGRPLTHAAGRLSPTNGPGRVSYWATGAPALKSTDGSQALVLGRTHRRARRTWTSGGRLSPALITPATTPPSGSRSAAARPRSTARSASGASPTWPGPRPSPSPSPLLPAGAGVHCQRRRRGPCPLAVGGFAIVGTLLVPGSWPRSPTSPSTPINLTTALEPQAGYRAAACSSSSPLPGMLRAGREPACDALVAGRAHLRVCTWCCSARPPPGRLPARLPGVPPPLHRLRRHRQLGRWPRSAPWSCSGPAGRVGRQVDRLRLCCPSTQRRAATPLSRPGSREGQALAPTGSPGDAPPRSRSPWQWSRSWSCWAAVYPASAGLPGGRVCPARSAQRRQVSRGRPGELRRRRVQRPVGGRRGDRRPGRPRRHRASPPPIRLDESAKSTPSPAPSHTNQ